MIIKEKRSRIMKKTTAGIIIVILCFLLTGCGEEKKEWTYELLEEEFGGVVELDFDSAVTCLRLLANQSYCVSGYVIDTNDLSPDILTLSPDPDAPASYRINVGQGRDNRYFAAKGETVYIKAHNIESYTENYYLTTLNITGGTDGYVSPDKKEEEYLSVPEFIRLMDEIYEDTYFKTEGYILRDGEDYEGNPQYYLYPSEEAYKENKYNKIELQFPEAQYHLAGKEVVIIGNPDINAFHESLQNCRKKKKK